MLLGALAKRTDGKLPTDTDGTLTARKVGEAHVRHGDATSAVELVMFTGVGFTPQFVWATRDASPRLFAFIVPGYVKIIEDGWQNNGAASPSSQKAAEARALVDLERRVASAGRCFADQERARF